MSYFSKVNERDKLKPRRDPYWIKISKGCYLGYRKMSVGASGTWSARFSASGYEKQIYKTLEEVTDLPDHQRYDAAQKAAQAWFEHLGKGGTAKICTLSVACNNYVSHLQETKGAAAAENAKNRFRNYVLNNKVLSSIELSKLTPAHIANWRKSIKDKPTISGPNKGKPRSDSTLNRDMTCLRAALNHAYKDGLVTSDFAWRSKLTPIKNADGKREVYLDIEQRKSLIEHAQSADLAILLRALSLLPLRPGAMAALVVENYNHRHSVLTVGKDKSGKDRKITLPSSTAEFFHQQSLNKSPKSPLISRADARFWSKDVWKNIIKRAAISAKLPTASTAYSLRHSTITDLVVIHKLDLMTVAMLAGTSLRMIEKHYGHLLSDRAANALAGLAI